MFEALQRNNARGRVRRAFDTAIAVSPLAFELKGLLANHLCVVATGLLEESIRLHMIEYSKTKAFGYIPAFVASRISRTTNLSSEKLIALLRELDESLAEEMLLFLDDRRKSALNALVSLRHEVAHGRSPGTSIVTVRSYADVVFEILDQLDAVFTRLQA